MTTFDVVVVGAGPAGMAAAAAASHHGSSVCLIDDNATCGGQIWRNYEPHLLEHPQAGQFTQLKSALDDGRIKLRTGTSVVAHPTPNVLRLENSIGSEDVRFRRLILATGARERFLPFPGWTLPGVMGVGGLQAIVKAGLPIAGKRVLISGTGPLLLAVASALSKKGAVLVGVFEQASFLNLAGFSVHLLRHPGKLRDGAAYRASILRAPYRTGSWVVQAHGEQSLQSVDVSVNGSIRNFECDYLGCAFHLVPNLELPRLLNCEIDEGFVRVNDTQQTSVKGVYCVGEPTGIGGLEKALVEGEIAGLACAGRSATHLYSKRNRYMHFAECLDRAFALRPELKNLARPETFVCRCEDVSQQALNATRSWREAKLHTRFGMGPCQGRICGPAAEFLFDWDSAQVRPPIFPARVNTLASPAEPAQL